MESYHAHSTSRDEKQPSVITVTRIHVWVFWGIISKDGPASPFSKPFYNTYNENGYAVVLTLAHQLSNAVLKGFRITQKFSCATRFLPSLSF